MERITTLTHDILTTLGVEPFSVAKEDVAGTTFLTVATEIDLAGVGGERIRAINLLVRKMAEKEGLDERFTIDANGYYKAEVQSIEAQARAAAAEAQTGQKDIELPPMRAFDRMVAHAALTGMPNIKTESTGEGRDRRVVVKYAP
jgi:spoIIIJ-associated protein